MNPYDTPAKYFNVLRHPARLAILEALRGGEQCVCHLEAMLDFRQAYISQQLMVLREAGLVQDRRDGLNIFYHVVQPQLYEVIDAARRLSGEPGGALPPSPDCTCPKCHPQPELISS